MRVGGICESRTYCDAGTRSNASGFDGDRQTEIPGSKGAGEKVGWVKQRLQRRGNFLSGADKGATG